MGLKLRLLETPMGAPSRSLLEDVPSAPCSLCPNQANYPQRHRAQTSSQAIWG